MALATNVDLAALRAAYEGGASLRAITRDFCIGARRLSSLAREGGWSRPDGRKRRAPRPARAARRPTALDQNAVRSAYEGGEETVQTTCERLGIANSTLYALATAHQWRRKRRAYRKDALTAPASGPSSAPGVPQDQQALIARLYDILGAQIRALAARDGTQPENDDKATRQLEQLIKCVRTIHDLRAALGGPEAGNRDGGTDGRSSEEIRDEVFRRLDQRLAVLRAETLSGEPE